MTQLDLPPISFARYLDLLKRRKWQVVPVSLVGMIVGGLIAASVPRYYVASTDVHFNAEHLLSDQRRGLVDPLEELLANARPMVLNQVPAVLQQLGWQEAATEDPYVRADFIAEVRSRISVLDLGTEKRNRVNTNLRITYRDTDGVRAAEFANALRESWIEKQLGDLERIGNEEVQGVKERLERAQDELDAVRRERATFEAENELDPQVRGQELAMVERSLATRLNEQRSRVEDLLLEIDELTSEIEFLQQRETQVDKLIPAPPPPIDEMLQQELFELNARILGMRAQLTFVFKPGSAPHRELSRRLKEAEAELKAKVPVPAEAMVPNPSYTALVQQLEQLQNRRRSRTNQLTELRNQIADNERRFRQWPRTLYLYNEKLEAEQKAAARVQALEVELDGVLRHAQQVRASRPFETWQPALIPQRPTEPNITVLALMGSLIGLGIAVGLIFALDAVRFTFKTLDDLERGLPVPVLGGVSHIETLSERTQTRRSRLVVSGFAFLLLFLIVAVVTLYYMQPARLPVWARDLLDMVLGGE